MDKFFGKTIQIKSTVFSHVKHSKLKMASPFVSADFELRRIVGVLQCKEVLNVPSVSFGRVGDARLLNKQRFWRLVGFRSGDFDELDTKDAVVVDEKPRGLFLQFPEGGHARDPIAFACSLEIMTNCTYNISKLNQFPFLMMTSNYEYSWRLTETRKQRNISGYE